LLLLVSVTNTVVTFGATLLKPSNTLVGLVPVVNTVVKLISLYQVYMLPPVGVVIIGGVIAVPTQYELGVNVTAGATGTALTVKVTAVAGPGQLLLFVSVTNTVVVFAAALLKASCALVGAVPVVKRVDKLTSLYHLYVLPPTGVVITGGVIAWPTQYELGVKVTAGAAGIALTVRVTEVAGPWQLLLFVSATKTVVTLAATLLKPNCALVGVVPAIKTVVNPASLYQVYVLPPVGVVMIGATIASFTQ